MAGSGTFQSGGRTWEYETSEDGKTTRIFYEAPLQEAQRVSNKFGEQFTSNKTVQSGNNQITKYYVLASGYQKQPDGTFRYAPFPPGQETANGNANQVRSIGQNQSLKQQITESSTNTNQTNPNQPGSPGTSTPANPNQSQDQNAKDSDVLIYPLGMSKTQQDRIKFTAVKYEPSGTLSGGSIEPRDRKTVRQGPHVFLPVQASITDTNSVDWQGGSLNEIERRAVNASLAVMKSQTTKDLTKALQDAGDKSLKELAESSDEVRVAIAGAAVGLQNLLGRFGSVLNPNLELLFTGPQLRSFDFQFRLSAREEKEAQNIKKIINFFKKNMAVKGKAGEIFLRSPNTFFVEYKYAGGEERHPGLNLIKECALLNCSVDYTPNQTYMTFQEGTMVTYVLSLSFQELEPIYDVDYSEDLSTKIEY